MIFERKFFLRGVMIVCIISRFIGLWLDLVLNEVLVIFVRDSLGMIIFGFIMGWKIIIFLV